MWALKHPEELKRTTTSVLVQVPVQVPSGTTDVPVKSEVLAYREKEKEKKKRKWAGKRREDDNKGCFRCHSKTHWKRNCPVWLSEQASEQEKNKSEVQVMGEAGRPARRLEVPVSLVWAHGQHYVAT